MNISEEFHGNLRDILASSLKATPSTAQIFADTAGAASSSTDAGLRNIVAGILFSRRFIISYQAVLLGLLLLFSIRYWTSRLCVPLRRRLVNTPSPTQHEEPPNLEHESASSSSSSTIIGDSPSPKVSKVDEDNERAPLLKREYHPATFGKLDYPIRYSYESLNIVHRRLGEVMCLLALVHSAGMIGVWYTILRPTGFSLAKFLLSKIVLLGIGAFVAYELIYFTSLGSFRRRWYELFLALHVSLQVLALVLVWFHHHNSRPYVGVALAIFLIDRLLYRMSFKIHSARASLTVCEDGQTVIVCTESILTKKWQYLDYIGGAGVTKRWKPTEHVFLTVPALSRKHVIQAHPFTIASVAPDPDASSAELNLIIRAQDGFSKDLLTYAKAHDAVRVRLDGPYGSQNALHLLQQCDLAVVVAGGSGIAVALPLIGAIGSSRKLCDVEQLRVSSSILLVWIIRHASHAAWAGSHVDALRKCGVEVIMPPPTAKNGHPDVPNIVTSWISAHDDNMFSGKAKTGVVCSGPDGMNRSVRNTCSSLLAHGRNVDVEVEKFGW
ncbi:MAG: hypothetical protein Q9185_001921 [Variospora sp. 1 TL-2023]